MQLPMTPTSAKYSDSSCNRRQTCWMLRGRLRLDAKGKAKVLTSETAEKSASVDPQHQVTTADARSKGLIQGGTSSGRPPRSGIVITHRRPRENWQQQEDRYRRQQDDYRREEERRLTGVESAQRSLELPVLHPLLGGKYQASYCQRLP